MNFLNPFRMIYMIIFTLLLIHDFFPVFFLSDIVSPEALRIISQCFSLDSAPSVSLPYLFALEESKTI